MLENFEALASDLFNDLVCIPKDYEHAVNAQIKALAHLTTLSANYEVLRSAVALRVAQEGETQGKKYSLDRIQQGVDVDTDVNELRKAFLAAKITYEEMTANVKIIENRQKICHEKVTLLSLTSPFCLKDAT